MNAQVTQIVAGIVAAVVPVIVKLVNDWAEAHKAPAPAAGATGGASVPGPVQEVNSDRLS